MRIFAVLALGCCLFCSVAVAQEATPTPVPSCTDADRAGLDACVVACEAAVPQCQKAVIDLATLRAKIAEKCKCDNVKNFGQYRSCVNSVVNPMRAFALLNAEAKAAIAADNAACKAAIASKKRKKK